MGSDKNVIKELATHKFIWHGRFS